MTREIGPYRLVARLGAGAMGEVWRAIDTRLDRQVAVKLLPSAYAGDAERRGRMLREAKAAAAVPHPNVVTLFDIGSEGGQDYLVMELVDGRTLAERLKEGPLPLREALDIAVGVAEALAAAHKKGILHRDVKAANVMLTRDGAVKVLDFGLAKLRAEGAPNAEPAPEPEPPPRVPRTTGQVRAEVGLSETLVATGSGPSTETRAGTLLGTPAYFSPEQVQGALPDEKSEIFSVGVLIYELVTGKSPFPADTMEALFKKILVCKPDPPDAPEPVARVIATALAAEPSLRHADMSALVDDLRAARDTLFAPRARKRWPLIAAAAVLAACVAALIAWRVFRRPPASPVDQYLERALGDYDVYSNDKATTSLRTAIRIAPEDPRPYAYLVIMQLAPDAERARAATDASARLAHAGRARDRALVEAAVTLVDQGPAAARARLQQHLADRELAFWNAELAWQAGLFDEAADGYAQLLEKPEPRFLGRIYDHYSSCLLYRDRIPEAVAIGEAYAKAFPGEADALGTEATTYAAAGRLDEALKLAEDARAIDENEDTLAGLAKVRALRGEFKEAERLYRQSVAKVAPARRPLRRATLAMLLLLEDRKDDARAEILPCLPPNGEDAAQRTVSVCLLVAGLVDESLVPVVVPELSRRAHVAPPAVAYGRPDNLARVLQVRRALSDLPDPAPEADARALEEQLAGADDLFAVYHLPFYSSYKDRLLSEIAIRRGDAARAVALLEKDTTARPADGAALLLLARAQALAKHGAAALRTLDTLDRIWPTADPDLSIIVKAKQLRATLHTL